jgi:hypothetical protein
MFPLGFLCGTRTKAGRKEADDEGDEEDAAPAGPRSENARFVPEEAGERRLPFRRHGEGVCRSDPEAPREVRGEKDETDEAAGRSERAALMASPDGFRGFLCQLAPLFGDVNAVEKGRVPRRIGRRVARQSTGRLLGKLFR